MDRDLTEITCTVIRQANDCTESLIKIGKDLFYIKSYFGEEDLYNILNKLALEKIAKRLEVSADLCYD